MLKSKLVLTGGQCAGKTTLVNMIRKKDINRQYIIVPETATLIYRSGLRLERDISNETFQKLNVLIQYYRECKAERIANEESGEKIIVCDRGLLDSIAYTSKEEYNTVIKELGLDYDNIINSYDSVLFMESLAVDEPNLYKQRKNQKDTRIVVKRNEVLKRVWKDAGLSMDYMDNCSDDFIQKAVMGMHYITYSGKNLKRKPLRFMSKREFYSKLHAIFKEAGLEEDCLDEYLKSKGI